VQATKHAEVASPEPDSPVYRNQTPPKPHSLSYVNILCANLLCYKYKYLNEFIVLGPRPLLALLVPPLTTRSATFETQGTTIN
jgi:hypothetical protein